jgi:hypothetical protein
MPPPEVDDLTAWLESGQAAAALRTAQRLAGDSPKDPLAAAVALRTAHPELEPGQAAAALEQAALRTVARERYGFDGDRLLLTRDGLEQATRPDVAAYRADLLLHSGVRRVVDLTAGLGFDVGAFAAAGLAVTAVERDPRTAAFCRHNQPAADVIQADVTAPGVLDRLLAGLRPTDAVFVDPARRDTSAGRDLASGRARPERDPERWSPPWSFIRSVPHPRLAIKASPAFSPPDDWHAAWSSVDRVAVECGAYSWPVFGAARRAVIHGTDGAREVDADPTPLARACELGGWLLEPDPALERAGALSALVPLVGADLGRVDDESTWLTSDGPPEPAADGLVRSYRVVVELTGSTTDQRRALRDRSIDRLTVKSRDVRVDPLRVLRDLGCSEGRGPVLIVTRRSGRVLSVLTDAVPWRRG